MLLICLLWLYSCCYVLPLVPNIVWGTWGLFLTFQSGCISLIIMIILWGLMVKAMLRLSWWILQTHICALLLASMLHDVLYVILYVLFFSGSLICMMMMMMMWMPYFLFYNEMRWWLWCYSSHLTLWYYVCVFNDLWRGTHSSTIVLYYCDLNTSYFLQFRSSLT